MMAVVALAATILFILVSWVVSLRLLRRGSSGSPEQFLGMGLLLIVGVGLPLITIGRVAALTSVSSAKVVTAIGTLTMTAGWLYVTRFTWRVFRPSDKLGSIGACALTGALVISSVIAVLQLLQFTDAAQFTRTTAGMLAVLLSSAALYVWAGTEAMRCYLQGKKRLRLGLADPEVTQRFFYWSMVMFFSFLSVLAPVFVGFTGGDPNGPPVQLHIALTGCVCAFSLYRAFLAPVDSAAVASDSASAN